MKKRHILLTVAVAALNAIFGPSATAELPPKEKLHVYVLLGQSNMQGTGGRFYAEDMVPETRILKYEPIRVSLPNGDWDDTDAVLYGGAYYPYFVGNWVDFTAPACINIWIPAQERYYEDWPSEPSLTGVGPGRSFAREILATVTDPEVRIGVVGLAIPGQRIAMWVKNYSTHYPDIPVADSGLFYTNNLHVLQDIQQFATIKGVLWHQGESDSGNSLYAEMLKRIVNDFRTDLGIPDLPWVCGQVGTTGDETWGVNFHLKSIVDEGFPNFGVASSAGMVLYDHIHYDRDSQWEYGRRYAAKLLEVRPVAAEPAALKLVGIVYNPPEFDVGITNLSPNVHYAITAADDLSSNGSTVDVFMAEQVYTNRSIPLANIDTLLGNPAAVYFRANDTDAP